MTLRAIILGAGAGGGFPQWNSAAPGCLRARAGDPLAKPRTQASVAVSADGGARWLLLNASPDIAAQIAANPALHPRPAPGRIRHSPIAAVAVTGAEVDSIAGLLSLRERHPFALYAAAKGLAALAANPIFSVLDPALVPRRELPLDRPLLLTDATGVPLGLTLEAFAVPGKVALFQEQAGADPGRADDGDTIGLRVTAAGSDQALYFIPGCAALTAGLRARLAGAACLLFDGTLFRDDEMILAGAGAKTGTRMGHMNVQETLASFADLPIGRRILIHINNTNPILLEDSAERAVVRGAGWEVAEDGMEITL
jgi:pyrroloquinoline quinone biosynthesis protein B